MPQYFTWPSTSAAGAEILLVPAAFTKFTGQAHWELLLRARAIENTCYVIAPNQCGHHFGDRYSYGHSLIVDPWGEVLADGGENPGLIVATVDVARVLEIRRRIPTLENARPFTLGGE